MKIFLGFVGCRLNQSELEILAADLRSAGHEIVADAQQAQAAIINSCTVTAAADADSRQMVHRLQRLGVQKIYLTGCWVSVQNQDDQPFPEGVVLVHNLDKMKIPSLFFCNTAETQLGRAARIPLPGKARRTRAFIKVQEGCDYHCTFCITRIARGRSISRPLEQIMQDIQSAIQADVKEVVLSGTQLGGWGKDLPEKRTIAYLVGAILEQTNIPQVRLSSIEPWDIQSDFLPLLTSPRFCAHLHLPLQSGSLSTLKRMGRSMHPEEYSSLVQKIRSLNPDIAITTDVVVGFPGEDDLEFSESLSFVRNMEFAGGHVFRYSLRTGTPAASYPNQVDGLEKRARNGSMRSVLQESAKRYRARFVNRVVPVLWEKGQRSGAEGWIMEGLSTNYIRVQAASAMDLWNTLSRVKLKEDHGVCMIGEICQDNR